MFNKVVGAQLVELNNNGFTVKRGDEYFHFDFIEDEGDCCGYNDISTNLFISPSMLSRNPVITKIDIENDDDTGEDSATCRITFFGKVKKMAEVETLSSSGSGYSYGACVSCVCRETEEKEVLSFW